MSWNNKVIWSEGMFLQPQHLQQNDRHVERMVNGRVAPLRAWQWGFGELRLDEDALALGKIALSSASGLFPDGTPFDFPGIDRGPEPIELPAEVKDELVVLAVPMRRQGGLDADVAGGGEAALARYLTAEAEVADSTLHTAQTALVQVGQLNVRLMRASEVTDAYATLGVVRVRERRVDNQVVLDKDYIAPMLSVQGSAVLAGYVREIRGLLHQRGEVLAARMGQAGRGGVAEIADFLLLQTINRFEPVFDHFDEQIPLHPERLFSNCLMLAGDLSTFASDKRRPGSYPSYRQDELEKCFPPLMVDLRRSLSMVLEQNAIPIELQERKYGVRVAMVPDKELFRNSAFVLAVNAEIAGEVLRSRFPTQTKIGPVERIRDLVNLQLPGIALRSMPVAPRQIPYHSGFNYFELERSGDLWKQLNSSGGLAMHIAGEFPGLELEMWAIRN
ncbi:MAG: type VI secretion system baseplate subunit TssK [Rhodocyclaceae bacterium]|nr:type VI secretion system baseplate subunit TssK [Rhodocyclaceae bacterium]